MNKEIVLNPPDTASEKEIIHRILAGEKRLFEILMRKYNGRLFKVGMAIINNSSEVEDIMQTSYIKAYENLSKFENRSSFGTWLLRIMINESIFQLKRKKSYMSIEDARIYNGSINLTNGSSEIQTPSGFLINKELAKALEASLSELPEKYRLVFVLREIEDMSVAETVDVLNISESNVKVRLNRAKEMLRNKLHGYYKSDQIYHFHLNRCNKIVENVFSFLKIDAPCPPKGGT